MKSPYDPAIKSCAKGCFRAAHGRTASKRLKGVEPSGFSGIMSGGISPERAVIMAKSLPCEGVSL